MKLFNDILARTDRTHNETGKGFHTDPTPIVAGPSEAISELTGPNKDQDHRIEECANDEIGDVIEIHSQTSTVDSSGEDQKNSSMIEAESPDSAKMANVTALCAELKADFPADGPKKAEDEAEVPIWELAPVEKQNSKKSDGGEDESLSELARAALQTIENRKNPGNDTAAVQAVTGVPAGGRAKTRLLGFNRDLDTDTDVFAQTPEAPVQKMPEFPVGWLVVVKGPGRGAQFTLCDCVAQIGRGEDQAVRLDFGDSSISRDNHAAIAYDEEQNKFFLGHGGKANLVRLNGNPVLSTEELSDGDKIRIGETTMRFVALCSPNFAWCMSEDTEANRG